MLSISLKGMIETELLALSYYNALLHIGEFTTKLIKKDNLTLGIQAKSTATNLVINIYQSSTKLMTNSVLNNCKPSNNELNVIVASYEDTFTVVNNCEILPFYKEPTLYLKSSHALQTAKHRISGTVVTRQQSTQTQVSKSVQYPISHNTPKAPIVNQAVAQKTVSTEPLRRPVTKPTPAPKAQASDALNQNDLRRNTLLNELKTVNTLTAQQISTLLDCHVNVAYKLADSMANKGELTYVPESPKSSVACYTISTKRCREVMEAKLSTKFSKRDVAYTMATLPVYSDIDEFTLKCLDAILNYGYLSVKESNDNGFDFKSSREPDNFNRILSNLNFTNLITYLEAKGVNSTSLTVYRKLKNNYAKFTDISIYLQEESISTRAYLANFISNKLLTSETHSGVLYIKDVTVKIDAFNYENPIKVDYDIVDKIGDRAIRTHLVDQMLLSQAVEEGKLVVLEVGKSLRVCHKENEAKFRAEFELPPVEETKESFVEEVTTINEDTVETSSITEEEVNTVIEIVEEAVESESAEEVKEEVSASTETLETPTVKELDMTEIANNQLLNAIQEGSVTVDELKVTLGWSKRRIKSIIDKLLVSKKIKLHTKVEEPTSRRKNAKRTITTTYEVI